jgi:iron complex outermembrane receptor protein
MFRNHIAVLLAGAVLPLASASVAHAQQVLPEIEVTAPAADPPGTLAVAADRFGSVTVVPSDELRRNGGTLGDTLFGKAGITGSSFAPGASSRPIVRGLDNNRVGIVENGVGGGGASDLGEDHFVPVDPVASDQVEVIRGPAALRYGTQAIGGVVNATNNRIPEKIPERGASAEVRTAVTSVDAGTEGALLLDAGKDGFAVHADVAGRRADDYRIPKYPYLTAPDATAVPFATQPWQFNGRQPNTRMQTHGESFGLSHVFANGFIGAAITLTNALYRIPGAEGEGHRSRIDAAQTKGIGKGEFRAPADGVDVIRFWWGITDYRHNELGLADAANPGSDGVRQTFTNKELEGRTEVQMLPFDLCFAAMTTTFGVQAGQQALTAPGTNTPGLFDPNDNRRAAAYLFNEFKFSEVTRAQVAGRVDHVRLNGMAAAFPADFIGVPGPLVGAARSPEYTPLSVSAGLIQNLPWDIVGSVTAQHIERAPKPAELFSRGAHDATGTFDIGDPNLKIEKANSIEAGLRRAKGPVRFEANVYYTRFNGFIFRRFTGNTCDDTFDTCVAGPGAELNQAVYSQRDAVFRGGEAQAQWDFVPVGTGFIGVDGQYDIVRATFTDGTSVPRIPPQRAGGGLYFRDSNWFVRTGLLHAFAQNDVAPQEPPTGSYNLLRAEAVYRTVLAQNDFGARELSLGVVGTNLLNEEVRNHVSFLKDSVLMPGAGVRVFATIKY